LVTKKTGHPIQSNDRRIEPLANLQKKGSAEVSKRFNYIQI